MATDKYLTRFAAATISQHRVHSSISRKSSTSFVLRYPSIALEIKVVCSDLEPVLAMSDKGAVWVVNNRSSAYHGQVLRFLAPTASEYLGVALPLEGLTSCWQKLLSHKEIYSGSHGYESGVITVGEPGPAGKQGKVGSVGPVGPTGVASEVNYDNELVKALDYFCTTYKMCR